MGRPKLLLPWGGRTVLEQVLLAWKASPIQRIALVVHPDDALLADLGRQAGVDVVVPEQPPVDMLASVCTGLAHLEARYHPLSSDAWLLAPADFVALVPPLVESLLSAYDSARPETLVAAHGGRRGHPVLFPWAAAEGIRRIPSGEGIHQFVRRHGARCIEAGPAAVAADLNTPADYEALRQRYSPR